VPVVRVRRLHARDDLRGQHLDRPSARQRQHLVAADTLEAVEPAVGLRHRDAGHQHAVVLHEDDRLVAHQRGQPFAFGERGGQAGVVVVVGDLAVEEGRGLAGRHQPVVGQHVERHRPGLVGVQHDARAGQAVDRRMDALGREFQRVRVGAVEHLPLLVEDDQVAGARFRPVQAERQDQVLPVASRNGHREVVVDAFVELVQHRQPQRAGQLDARLGDRVSGRRARTVARVRARPGHHRADGHRGSPRAAGKRGQGRRAYPPAARRQQSGAMTIVHLVDGTYELFRHVHGQRRFVAKGAERPFGAVVGVLQSVLEMIEQGGTHVGVATDHVIESFRNALWPGYKTGAGIEPALIAQFHPLEDALRLMGVVVWPMVEFEADDALAAAAARADADPAVEKVCIWSPDKDLAQCVRDDRVVQIDRRSKAIRDAAAVRAKYGVPPELIADWLALVGDAADGYPGIAGIGAVTAAAMLNRLGPIEGFAPKVLGEEGMARALLFKRLAVLRTDAPSFGAVDELRWRGPTAGFAAWTEKAKAPRLLERCLAAHAALGPEAAG
jgi:5'-3' exonuclease